MVSDEAAVGADARCLAVVDGGGGARRRGLEHAKLHGEKETGGTNN